MRCENSAELKIYIYLDDCYPFPQYLSVFISIYQYIILLLNMFLLLPGNADIRDYIQHDNIIFPIRWYM